MENVRLLKEYFLSYASCIYCSTSYGSFDSHPIEFESDHANQVAKCADHQHVFGNFFIEKHLIPTIMQQFLIDLEVKTVQNVPVTTSDDAVDDQFIDIKEMEAFWNDYVTVIPVDLQLIWDTIDNGLVRYLQVCRILFEIKEIELLIWYCLFL